jgi:hypothetical protein
MSVVGAAFLLPTHKGVHVEHDAVGVVQPHDRGTYAFKGHPYGLTLSADERGALIASLNTL